MIAEYGNLIPESPYLVEPLIDSFAEEQSQAVRLELLATAMRLFFHRPPEMQHMLGRLLDAVRRPMRLAKPRAGSTVTRCGSQAIADASFTDVHDRAMFYYRLLQYDVNFVSPPLPNHPSLPAATAPPTLVSRLPC